MNKITKLTLATIVTTSFAEVIYAEPCYTDVGCDMSDQIVRVTRSKAGTGFCTESADELDKKETKCYFQPPKIAKNNPDYNRLSSELPALSNINLMYASGNAPIIYTVPRQYRDQEYYSGYYNRFYISRQQKRYNNNFNNNYNNSDHSSSNNNTTSYSESIPAPVYNIVVNREDRNDNSEDWSSSNSNSGRVGSRAGKVTTTK